MAAQLSLALVLVACLVVSGDKTIPTWQTLYRRSVNSFDHADFESARRLADSGYRAACREPAPQTCSQFRLMLAESLIELDRLNEALPLLQVGAPNSDGESRRLADLAMLHFRKHDLDQVPTLIAGARGRVGLHDRELAGKIDLILGMLQINRDQLPQAEKSLKQALSSVEGSGSLIESYTLTDLGFLKLQQAHYDEALYWYGRARDLARAGDMKRALELAIINVGAAYVNLGDFDRAIENLQQAVQRAEQLHDRVYEIPALVLLGEACFRSGDPDKAAACYQRAREMGNPERDRWLANVLNDLSQLSLQKGDLAAAEDLNRQGAELAQRLDGPQALPEHRIQSAAIALARKQYTRAEEIYRETLAASEKAHDPVHTFECHAGLAGLYRGSGAPREAAAEFRAAAEVVDRFHSSLEDESKLSFLASLIDYYRDYVDFLFERGDAAGAFRVAESSRARVLEEKLHASKASAPAADLASLQQEARDSGATLLSYWLAPARSLLWAIDSGGLRTYRLPGDAEIAERVRAYNDAIQRGGNPGERDNEAGSWLYGTLLAVAHLPKNRKIVIEPDGVLHQLNFESLPADGPSHYALENSTIAVAPSLALLERSTYTAGGRLLAFGDPQYDGADFQRLPNTEVELQSVVNHFAQKKVYVAAAATPEAYRDAHPENYTILHFATHAVANRESPLDSAIILSGTADNRKLYAREILESHLSAQLVTLSACQTAGSRTYYGEGLTGFSWAFLSAGARNVVAGLWDVDDRATAILMKGFYDRLSAGLAPADALRRAKLDLLAHGGVYRKPRYWAAFEVFTRALY